MNTPSPMALTDEQRAVMTHDPSAHATVLAVAGSGKTTAMVHRIGHLIVDLGVPARSIRAVMFNRAARQDFEHKLDAVGIRGVRVQTFNALGHAVVGWAGRQGLCEPLTLLEDLDALRMVEQAISERRRGRGYDADPIDADEALAAIRTWKGLLTPPDQARCTERPELVEIYRLFEQVRQKAGRMTFDDQIGEAVRLIETSPLAQRTLIDRLDHLIIDEFQDVNHAQQRLARLIAGERARVMVVGDDDQCIYEWRGARSAYIKTAFRDTFDTHAHATYRLTRSFRFGPGIARVAANAIAHNLDRVQKPLVAADPLAESTVTLLPPARHPVGELRRLVSDGVGLGDIVALVRVFAQSYPLQAALIAEGVPFVVEGERSLLEGIAVRALRSYLHLAHRLDDPIDADAITALEHIVDKPNRYVKKRGFSRVLHRALAGGASVGDCLRDRFAFETSGVTARAAESLEALAETLTRAREATTDGIGADAIDIIRDDIDLSEWLAEWQSEARVEAAMATLDAFAALIRARQVPLDAIDDFVRNYDTRQGQPVDACLRITSIFRAKGLEWDHVLLPSMADGMCPHLRDDDPEVDNALISERALPRTEHIEAERRLFYVAVTRARRSVLIEVPEEADQRSRFIEDALVEATGKGIAALIGIARAGALSPGALDAICAATTHAPIHAAVPDLADRMATYLPGAREALDRVKAALEERPPAPPPAMARRRRPLARPKRGGLPI